MKTKLLKKSLSVFILGSMLLQSGLPVLAEQIKDTVQNTQSVNYGLTEHIRAAIKNLSVTQTEYGSQISATIRLYNGGDTPNRVPEHEFRVKTLQGTTYVLSPSAVNKNVLQPKEIIELVYLTVVDSKEIGAIDQLSFTKVNLFTYPKTETNLLSIPAGAVWYGKEKTAFNQLDRLAWGESFRIPGINSSLIYTPTEAKIQNANNSKAVVFKVLVENNGEGREIIPSFRVDAATDGSTFEGSRVETDKNILDAGGETYLHYIIPIKTNEPISELLVMSTDTFVGASGSENQTVSTGKLALAWQQNMQTIENTPNYSTGQPISFDPLTKVIDQQTEVSLMEFHVHDNQSEGYKTAIAKFKMTNTSKLPVSTPEFGSELLNDRGVAYIGSRQVLTDTIMNPGLSYVVNYSYTLPQDEEASRFTMKLLDETSATPYTTSVAAFQAQIQEEEADGTLSLYPFTLKVNDVQVSFLYNSGTYHYKFNLDLDIKQSENVVIDPNFSRIRFEVVDNSGRILGSQDAVLTGNKKLISGKQVLETSDLTTEQFNYPFTILMYEVFETKNGISKRLLKTIK
ncbi:hypothetical protein SAMN02799630_03324 [Paenibacillus sp. UNCCL117]|uniref:hypothetical protein n=1 Tax=unclassified Paenibacillus TaxID=185978 RepID=UPI00088EF0AF|nr:MULTISPECIES: hypothetical protein [unclassified Paenibacillus]SDD72929.1 hypothetical protein SAMN04488602_112139 [Paenibacillus sp. cl123]SFW45805.1 hypothetical protein SAMN02799630_03324 [Paenibacillus sp. UNCCL117]